MNYYYYYYYYSSTGRLGQCPPHLIVVLEGLGLVPLSVVELPQLCQHLGVSGRDADQLHQPINGLVGVLQHLIADIG